MESITTLTIPQITDIFSKVVHSENSYLNAFIHLWLSADDRQKTLHYNAAQEIIYHFKLEPHILPELPVSRQTLTDSAHIVRGFFDDCAMNAEEALAVRRCIWAAEKLGQLQEDLAEVQE